MTDSSNQNLKVIRKHAEEEYAEELEILRDEYGSKPKPKNWTLPSSAVVLFVLGGKTGKGKEIKPKYIGDRKPVEKAVATLMTEKAVLLLGLPGTAKSWLGENIAAAVCGDSTLAVQGTAGTDESALRYGWNYAQLIANGPTPEAIVKSSTCRAMEEGKIVRIEELTRVPSDVQDALISILSEKEITIPELNLRIPARMGFNVIATANDRDKGVNSLSSALQRRFDKVWLLPPKTLNEEVKIIMTRVAELGRAYEYPAELPAVEEIRRVAQIFRELRGGQTVDGKTKVKSPSGTLSTAEAISVVNGATARAAYFGDGKVTAADLAPGIVGAVVQDYAADKSVFAEYLSGVMKDRDGWGDLYEACKEHTL